MSKYKHLLSPFELGKGFTLRNRIVMSPMTTWAGNPDFTVSDEEIDWYKERVKGVGLVITGCTQVTPEGIGFTDEFAGYDDRFIPSLKKLADVAKSDGAPAILQLFHAGNKAYQDLIPGGDVVSASAIPSETTPFTPPHMPVPRALEEDEIWDIIKAFGATTRRAIDAGFDGIEVHGAHGFLNQNFLSPMFNQRTDKWGGSIENRLRFSIEVVREIRRVIALYAKHPFILGFRISPEELPKKGLRLPDTFTLIDTLINEQVDYLHFSLFQVLTQKPLDIDTDKTITKVLSDYVNHRLPVIAAGQITTPAEADNALDLGLDLVAIARSMVINPHWAQLVIEDREDEIIMVLDPEKAGKKKIPGRLMNIVYSNKGWIKTTKEGTV